MINSEKIIFGLTEVIVTPRYNKFAKEFWIYREKWVGQKPSITIPVIGGTYIICDVNENGGALLKDIDSGNEISVLVNVRNITLADSIKYCPFRIGESVIPSDLKALYDARFCSAHKYLNTEGNGFSVDEHAITGLLNNYYIFIDVAPRSEESFPFLWRHFKKIDK